MPALVAGIHAEPQREAPGVRRRHGVDGRDKPGHDGWWIGYAGVRLNVETRLSQSSNFTPARFMMNPCWATDSRLFQVQ